MKYKLLFRTLLTIFLISISVYFIVGLNRGTSRPKVKNDKYTCTDPKTNIEDKDSESVVSLTNDDFVIKDKNNNIELGGIYRDLQTNEKITKTVTANENCIYDVYEYENFKIFTQPDESSSSIIWSIDITTSVIKTSRSISVGDNISEVVKKYGDPDDSDMADSNETGQYIYQYNSEIITFFVDKTGEIVLIRYEIV